MLAPNTIQLYLHTFFHHCGIWQRLLQSNMSGKNSTISTNSSTQTSKGAFRRRHWAFLLKLLWTTQYEFTGSFYFQNNSYLRYNCPSSGSSVQHRYYSLNLKALWAITCCTRRPLAPPGPRPAPWPKTPDCGLRATDGSAITNMNNHISEQQKGINVPFWTLVVV